MVPVIAAAPVAPVVPKIDVPLILEILENNNDDTYIVVVDMVDPTSVL